MTLAKIAREYIWKNKAHILTGIGSIGVIGTAIFASKATLKADKIIKGQNEELTKKEIVKKVWKEYIPAGLLGLGTILAIVGSNRIQSKQQMALMALYSLSEKTFKNYQEKVIEEIGKGKATKIRDEVMKDTILKNPVKPEEIIFTGNGDTLCYDMPSKRYFYSDIEKIRHIENNFNERLKTEMCLSLNDLYYELGLEQTKLGDITGWTIDHGILDFMFSSQLTDKGDPCLVIDYHLAPLF